jgi:hypothetical protein
VEINELHHPMIIAFAFAAIGAILVLANTFYLRRNLFFIIALILTLIITALGVYFIKTVPKSTDIRLFFPMFSPLTTILLWSLARMVYKSRTEKEIIMHMHGLIPLKQEDRHVTSPEKNITIIILVMSVIIPYLVLILIK